MSKKREAILTTIGILIIIIIPTNILADPRPYPHYHEYYEPGTPVVPYYSEPYPNNPPFFYKDEFELTVRLILTDKSWKFSMPGFYITASGETEFVPPTDFNDDGKAKVRFELDRDDIGWSETVDYQSTDGLYYDSYTYSTVNRNGVQIDFKIQP